VRHFVARHYAAFSVPVQIIKLALQLKLILPGYWLHILPLENAGSVWARILFITGLS